MKFKIGDKVRSKEDYECSNCMGKLMTVIGIDDSTLYPITCKIEHGNTEIFDEHALELIDKVHLSIEDMSTETIEKYLEKRKKAEKQPKVFKGILYNFVVDNINLRIKGIDDVYINSPKTIKALKDAIAEWERRRK